MENEAKHEAAKTIRRIESEAKEVADKKAKEIISLAIKRYAGDYVAEKTVSYVNLPNEEMKGRIIGREGRNIRAIEAATGIDLIIDDTPEAVILSGFNPVRREVARLSLERLISDGRIHPARIEEVVKKVSQEMEVAIREAGEAADFRCRGPWDPSGNRKADRKVEVPFQLRSKCASALPGGGLPLRDHGRRVGLECQAGQAGRFAA